MKECLIWLQSGRCIEGTMEEQEAERLKEAFKNKSERPGISEFTDTDSILLVEMGKVDAVAINDPVTKEEVGFKTETP